METLDLDVVRSLRGSATRDRILLAAGVRKRAYLEQLAGDARVDSREARDAILGRLPRFAPELALVSLGLLVPLDHEQREFALTPKGEGVVRIRKQHADRRAL